jgi:hypothetical protein
VPAGDAKIVKGTGTGAVTGGVTVRSLLCRHRRTLRCRGMAEAPSPPQSPCDQKDR